MSTTTKAASTLGALRAAGALIELSETTVFSPGTTVRIAEIIDRNTAAAEMLEALEKARVLIRAAYTCPEFLNMHRSEESDLFVENLDALIQKARGGQ